MDDENEAESGSVEFYKDDGYIDLVLKLLAAMCDGQYADLQASHVTSHAVCDGQYADQKPKISLCCSLCIFAEMLYGYFVIILWIGRVLLNLPFQC